VIYRIASDGTGLEVDDGEGDMFALPTADHAEAQSLIATAMAEGIDAIRPKKAGKK
jgi:hypothetical protein